MFRQHDDPLLRPLLINEKYRSCTTFRGRSIARPTGQNSIIPWHARWNDNCKRMCAKIRNGCMDLQTISDSRDPTGMTYIQIVEQLTSQRIMFSKNYVITIIAIQIVKKKTRKLKIRVLIKYRWVWQYGVRFFYKLLHGDGDLTNWG